MRHFKALGLLAVAYNAVFVDAKCSSGRHSHNSNSFSKDRHNLGSWTAEEINDPSFAHKNGVHYHDGAVAAGDASASASVRVEDFHLVVDDSDLTVDPHGQRVDSHGHRVDAHGSRVDVHGHAVDKFDLLVDGEGNWRDTQGRRVDTYGYRLNDHGDRVDAHGHPVETEEYHVDSHGHRVDSHGHPVETEEYHVDSNGHRVHAHGHPLDIEEYEVDDHGHRVDAHGHLVEIEEYRIKTEQHEVDTYGYRKESHGHRVHGSGSVDADGYRLDADGNRVDANGNQVDDPSDPSRTNQNNRGSRTSSRGTGGSTSVATDSSGRPIRPAISSSRTAGGTSGDGTSVSDPITSSTSPALVFTYESAVLAAGFSPAAVVTCNSDLLIDDFSTSPTNNRNNLGSWTSDDGSMAAISGSGGILSFTPRSGAYYYETFPCQMLSTNAYTHVELVIKAPVAGAAFTAQLTTAPTCTGTKTKTNFRVTGLTGNWQTVRIPLSSFAGANLDAALSVVVATFSSNLQWQLDTVSIICSQAQTTSTSTTSTQASSVSTVSTAPTISGSCSPLLVDDWASQSRLDFLEYNSLLLTTDDDDTMQSVLVDTDNHVTLTPKSTSSYFYSQTGCVNTALYGGIALRIKAAAGTTFRIELSSKASCASTSSTSIIQTTAQLGWTFDGTEKLYSFPWSKYSGIVNLRSIIISTLSRPITLGPLSLYCGSTPAAWVVPTTTPIPEPTGTVPAPSATVAGFVIDTFSNPNTNALGLDHSGDGLSLTWGSNRVTIVAPLPDFSFQSLLSNGCRDMRSYSGAYLHIAFSGHNKFSVTLQQNNAQCDDSINPYPETRDSLEAARYTTGGDIYIPISHFNINLQRVSSVGIRGIWSTSSVTFTKFEIVSSIPPGVNIPQKAPSGTLVFHCTRPNSFAFGIDDGRVQYIPRLRQIINDAGIKVTFFGVGAAIEQNSTGMADIYKQFKSEGHQIALHSYTHPRMESLPDYKSIDWEYNQDYRVMESVFGERSPYFRPPYGVEGARMRQRFALAAGPQAAIINWDIDVEDYLWAESSTPEKQLDAFDNALAAGGNLVVMHYSYSSTVEYLAEFIQRARAAGKQIMRVDQCLQDPNAPPL